MGAALLTTSIPSGNLVSRGKVRDIYETDDALVLVATDRISAFDSVLSPGIPGRGEILTRLSTFWFHRFADRVPNHLLATDRLVDAQAFEEVIVSTLPTKVSRWLRQDLPCRIGRKVSVPVTVVTTSTV